MNLKNMLRGVMFKFYSLFLFVSLLSCQKDSSGNPKNISVSNSVKPSTTNTQTTVVPQVSGNKVAKVQYKATSPISLYNVHDITISYDSINGGSLACISLTNCHNIHITKCKLLNSSSFGVVTSGCANIIVDSSYFYKVATGVFAYNTQGVQVVSNQFKNMQGPYPMGQFVQFNHVSGSGNSFINNIGENITGQSNTEDDVNMNASNGTASSPIMISGNWIRGGTSKTGGGIVLGDNGGSYQTAENNILVNSGAYGIGIADGTNMEVINNKVYGAQTSISNVGIGVQNDYGLACSLNTITGNYVNWTNAKGVRNDNWNANNCGTIIGWANNTWNANINASLLPVIIITYK